MPAGRNFGFQREHRIPVEPLVQFFCQCVEHLCGGGETDVSAGVVRANGFGAAGFGTGAPSSLPRRCACSNCLCNRPPSFVRSFMRAGARTHFLLAVPSGLQIFVVFCS